MTNESFQYEDERIPTHSFLSHSIFIILGYTVLALGVYIYASCALSREILPLEERRTSLTKRLHHLLRTRAMLTNIVSSLSDPAADEYALITELGRIPEGSRLVIIHPPPNGTP